MKYESFGKASSIMREISEMQGVLKDLESSVSVKLNYRNEYTSFAVPLDANEATDIQLLLVAHAKEFYKKSIDTITLRIDSLKTQLKPL